MYKTILDFIEQMDIDYHIRIPKEPLIKFAKKIYHLGFIEPHTSDELPTISNFIGPHTDMNEWNY